MDSFFKFAFYQLQTSAANYALSVYERFSVLQLEARTMIFCWTKFDDKWHRTDWTECGAYCISSGVTNFPMRIYTLWLRFNNIRIKPSTRFGSVSEWSYMYERLNITHELMECGRRVTGANPTGWRYEFPTRKCVHLTFPHFSISSLGKGIRARLTITLLAKHYMNLYANRMKRFHLNRFHCRCAPLRMPSGPATPKHVTIFLFPFGTEADVSR